MAVTATASSYIFLNESVDEFERRLLFRHVERVRPFVAYDSNSWNIQLPKNIIDIFSFGRSGYVLAITDYGGRVLYSSLPDHSSVVPPPIDPGHAFVEKHHGRSVYYTLVVPVWRKGHVAWIQIGQDLADPEVIVDDVAARFLSRIVWPFLILVPIIIILDLFILRRLLAPVLAASAVASTIGPTNLSTRLPTSGLPREVLPLALAVNDALSRLERALEVQREFTADAAHELRTPLTILRARVDTETHGNFRDELRADIDAVTHILDQLLELAELETLSETHQSPLDLNALAVDIATTLAPFAMAQGRPIAVQASDKPNIVIANAAILSLAIKNLLENAIRHTPLGSEVVLSTETQGQIRILDTGPGISESDRSHLFQRFWRKDRQEAGHAGLGLAIVARIVGLHGGRVQVEERPGGGSIFSMWLPYPPNTIQPPTIE